MTIIETIVCVLGLIFIAILLFLLLNLVKYKIEQMESDKEWEYRRTYLLGDMHDLIRWCSYDFPITEDVAMWITSYLRNQSRPNISDFRDQLRRKYGSKEE